MAHRFWDGQLWVTSKGHESKTRRESDDPAGGSRTEPNPAEAAEILGCHFWNIAKLFRKGELHSERRRGAALDRADVEALAERRRLARDSFVPKTRPPVDPRPDARHEWPG